MPSFAQLRAQVAALEGQPADGPDGTISLGVAAIDEILPGGGLAAGALHEIALSAMTGEEDGAGLGFAAYCLGRLAVFKEKPVLWIGWADDLYPPALAALGLSPSCLIMVRPQGGVLPQWALEEALRCRALAGVVAELKGLDDKAARRLQLAARASGVTALVVNRGRPSAFSMSRWRIAPEPMQKDADFCWQVDLTRCRGRGVGAGDAVAVWHVAGRRQRAGGPLLELCSVPLPPAVQPLRFAPLGAARA